MRVLDRAVHLAPPMASLYLNLFRLAFIYLSFSIWPMFVFLQFFSSFLIISLITSTVFISHGFADCRLSIVCVYLQPSIYISDSSPLLLPYCLFIHIFQPISGSSLMFLLCCSHFWLLHCHLYKLQRSMVFSAE